MDIAAVATQMHSAQLSTQVSTAVLDKTMDAASQVAQQLVEDLAALSAGMPPHKIDISV